MKRFILLSLLVALIPSSANSWGVMGMSGGVAAAVTKNTEITITGGTGDYTDGYLLGPSSGSCSTARGSGSNVDTTSDLWVGAGLDSGSYTVLRGYLTADTSSLPDTCTITKVEFHIRCSSDWGSNAWSGIIAAATQGTAITTADWASYGAAWSSATAIDRDSGDWTTFAFNATGIAGIVKDGNTQFAFLHNTDFGGSCPANVQSTIFSSANDKTAGNRPHLYIEYTE